MDNTDLTVLGSAEIGNLVMKDSEEFAGLGKTTVGNVYSEQDNASIITTPKLTKDKAGNITKTEPTLTISGEMEGEVNISLYDAADEETLSLITDGLSDLAEGNGIPFAKAVKANPELVLITGWGVNGHVYKKSGVFVIKTTEPQVELSYTMESEPVKALYETFADAVKEIENLKTVRDYTITFKKSNDDAPLTLTMPKAGSVNTLTLNMDTGVERVCYEKDITFNSHVVLEDINFVQMAKNKQGTYEESHVVKAAENKYVDPVKVTVSGAYELSVDGTATFNTPITLSGSSKATLTLDNAVLFASSEEVLAEDGDTYVEGSITKFAKVNADTDMKVAGYLTGASNVANPTYKGTELAATDLNIGAAYSVNVGRDEQTVDKVTVTNLNIAGDLLTYGNAELKNVVLSGDADIDVRGQKFNITGTLTSTTNHALLETVVGAKDKKSVLNISGNVVLENPENKITVNVSNPDDIYFFLGGTYTDEAGSSKTYSNKLLTAKTADINAFLADPDCVDNKGAYSADNQDGYILKKTGNDILVYYGEEVGAALYKNSDLYNYYPTVSDAVAAINALKDKEAWYQIKLLQDAGSEAKPITLTMPTQADYVSFSTDGDYKKIYYGNDISLATPTEFDSVELVPTVVNGKAKGINVKGFVLSLRDVKVPQSGLGKIDGGGKNSMVSITKDRTSAEIMKITGDVTNVTNLSLNGIGTQVDVAGKVTVTNLTLEKRSGDDVIVLHSDKEMTITNIYNYGGQNLLSYGADSKKKPYLIIKGNVENDADSNLQLVYNTSGVTPLTEVNNKVVLADAAKIATIEKAPMTAFTFRTADSTITDVCWAKNGIYVKPADYTDDVTVSIDGEEAATCLDFAQAVTYINGLKDKDNEYEIILNHDIADTDVTADANAVSKLTMPNKDVASKVTIDGNTAAEKISFTGDITANGVVEFKDVKLQNTADYSIKAVKNSDDKKAGIVGESELTFNNVENVISTNDKGGKFGYIKSITGEKNATVLTLEDTELLSTAKSDVATLKLASGGAWAALGATTIGTVDNSLQNENSYLGTSLVKGVPQLTITGVVEKPAQMKLYDFTTKEEISGEYNNQPLAIAKTESADKFIASGFASFENSGNAFAFSIDSVKAYKDKNNYVYNGDISAMDVLLESNGTQTYVKTYAEAVQIIDNIGDKTADYCITLRDTTNNEGIIKTALDKNMNAVYGALALPKAGKAASLTIVGEDENITLKYTGTMKPNCALTFESVTLTEGKTKTVNGEVIFTSSDFITPELGDVNITFGTNVKTLNAAAPADFVLEAAPDLVFNMVTTKSKGTLDISGHNVYVNGEIKINNLSITSDATLSGKGKITLDEITGRGMLNVNTAYTNKAWKTAVTQFTINGEMSSDVKLAITQYFCENKIYAPLELGYAMDLLFDGASKPAAWKKIITASKLQIQQNAVSKQISFVNYETNDTDYYVLKYDGGVYLTQTRPVIEVKGFKPGTGDTSYIGYFMTWDQAVKEIDKLGHANDKNGNGGWDYTITLSEDIGTIGEPLSTLTLPSKAAKVTIVGEDDYYKDENGEPIKDNQNNPIPDIEGIAIKSTNVSLKTDIEIKVPIVAVKKFGNSYYAIPYTLNAGNYNLVLNEIPNGADFDNMGYYEPQMKLSGSAKGSVEVIPYTNDGNNYVPVITQISNVGTMTFESAVIERDVIEYYYDVADGITGVGELILKPGVVLGSKSKDVSVKKLTMGESVAPVGDEYKPNEHSAGLEAKNITVSDTLDMASAWLKAGTSNTGDGKVTLNNVVFEDNHNSIEGKQDAKGVSQIQIKGTVSAKGDNIRAVDSAVTIGLYYNNSSQRFVQLIDGMTLLTAPKAASSWFRPNYAWNDDKETPENPDDDDYYANMGPEIGADICRRDNNGAPVFEGEGESKSPVTEWVPTYGTYKSGNFIKYGKLRDVYEFEHADSDGTWKLNDTAEIVEARVWVGTDGPWDDTANYMEFMTFEEAVKAIDSMGITQKYCIEILRDVEIGNEKGDNKYSALSLPSKASDVTIWGNGCEIRFAGNVTLKCDTTFKDVNLTPLKTVKNGAEVTKANITAGNFVLTWEHASMADETGNSLVGNITGSSKSGELKVMYDTWLFATNITGFKSVVFAGDINGPGNGGIVAGGNVTTKEIRYEENAAGILDTAGNLTTDYVTVEDGAHANLNCYEGKNVKVNGTTLTEGGNKVNTSVAGSGTVKMLIFTESGLQPGSKLLSGKYLNADNWNIYVGTPDGEDVKETAYSSYVNGTDLLLGNEIVTGP